MLPGLKRTGAKLAGAFRVRNFPAVPGSLLFCCNICGNAASCLVEALDRESPSCARCGSNVRYRSVVRVLSQELLGRACPLPEFPRAREIVGLGMSDSPLYAAGLEQKFSYINTYYHQAPFFDILDPPLEWHGRCDFIVTSDVFEHVKPPVSLAFAGLRKALKPGGVVIFTAPFGMDADTVEHYPELWEYEVRPSQAGPVLVNTTRDGATQHFAQPVFHGGDGTTLEMRLFSQSGLLKAFASAGFKTVSIHDQSHFDNGIHWNGPCSVTISAR